MTKTVAPALGPGLLAGRGGPAPEPITITDSQGEMAPLGRVPGDPGSNDPEGLIVQPFSSPEPTGGFLEVTVTPGDAPAAAFRWFDEHGVPTYETVRTAG